MNIKEAFELVDSYIDPVDNDVIEAVDIIKAEIERKDEAIKWAIQFVEDYDPSPENNELYHVMKKALSEEE